MRTISCIVDEVHDGTRVYDVLRGQLGASDGCVRRAKQVEGGILLDGQPAFANKRVAVGQEVALAIDAPDMPGSASELAPEFDPVHVVHADDDLLVVDKPAGLVMYPSPSHSTGTLANRLAGWLVETGRRGGLHAVHRLDRGTSGLVVFALHSFAKERLQAQLHTGAFARAYQAVCEGIPVPPAGTIDAPLDRLTRNPSTFGVAPNGKQAVTHYMVRETVPAPADAPVAAWSLVDLRLETGRTHQIRIHLAHIGCPLVGDATYGSASPRIDRPALHSSALSIVHPVTAEHLSFATPLPPDMAQLLNPA